jgi:hypothetical protein
MVLSAEGRWNVRACGRGRALHVLPDGAFYVGRHYDIFHSVDDGQRWTRVTRMPCPIVRRLAQVSRLACRLSRHEVKALVRLPDGTLVASNPDGVFFARPGAPVMTPSRIADAGQPVHRPMCLSGGPGGRVVWGEYWRNAARREVRLYASDDHGRSFSVAHTFPRGDIKHVHNVVYDAHDACYWVLVGDGGKEPGIARWSADLRQLDWLGRGSQTYRAVCLFDLGDRLVYGTDSETEPNAVISLDKRSGRAERGQDLPGSCIYACRFGGLYVLGTTVEPSRVNPCRAAALWVSRDADRWVPAFQAPKDRWNDRYFQFGSFALPRGQSSREVILFSGQALSGIDGQLFAATLTADAP